MVLKLYSTLLELQLFQKEFFALNKLGMGHPNVVRAKDVKLLNLANTN